MSNTALAISDPILFESTGGRFKGKFRVNFGRTQLTPRALLYYEKSFWWTMFGAIGMLLSRGAKGKLALSLEYANMQKLERKKFGLNNKIVEITMADGATHKLIVDKFDDFIERVRGQVPQQVAVTA